MSANVNWRAAAGRGGRNRGRQRAPQRKVFVSDHPDEAMKKATFEMGQVVDATKFVKSMEMTVGFIGQLGRK